MTRRVAFWVTHLWGLGHMTRIAAIAERCAALGLETSLIAGGRPVPHLHPKGVRVIQLPPVAAADETYSTLIDDEGRPITAEWRDARARALQDAIAALAPDILVLEMYPFGRRSLAFELEPLIEKLRTRPRPPIILSSIRDILVRTSHPGRHDKVAEVALRDLDGVLVHGDPSIIALDETFPPAPRLGTRLIYTGYVVATPENSVPLHEEIVVSCGGGANGLRLALAALEAAGQGAGENWRIVAGPNMPDHDWKALLARAGAAILERSRPDLARHIAGARASIARAGYNTTLEALRAGTPTILVPWATPKETEQDVRARRLEALGWVSRVSDETLTGTSLRAALATALARGRQIPPMDLNGAKRSADIIARWPERCP